MELPPSKFPATAHLVPSQRAPPPPWNSHFTCGVPRREILPKIQKPSCKNDEDSESFVFGKKRWVHFIDVGGSGKSALALLALKQGYEGPGSDIAWSTHMDVGLSMGQWGQWGRVLSYPIPNILSVSCGVEAMKSEFDTEILIHAAKESNFWGISGKDPAMSISSLRCKFIPLLDNVVDKLVDMASKNPDQQMFILTLGPGDITMVGKKLLQELQKILP